MISQEIVIDGKRYKIALEGQFKVTPIDAPPVPNPDPEPGKPTEGTIKEGGWGAGTDATKWKATNMRNPSDQFKVVDDKDINVATNFKTLQAAQEFINYFKTHPFPPQEEGEPDKPEPPVTPPPAGSGFDKNGVQLLFAKSENVTDKFEKDVRGNGDGIRWNAKIDGATASEAWGYFRFSKNPVDDEVSIKWSEKSHSGSNAVQCYDTGVSIKSGKVRMRFENPHPNYSGNIGSGQGEPLKDKWIGYKGVKIPQSDGSVLIELYQDTGDNETKPSNQWKKVYSHIDTKYKRTGAHPFITIRVDDPGKKGQKDLEEKWLGAAKI